MNKLYEEFQAFNEGYLKVSDLHEIYYEEAGNPHGIPVVVLHGGPGSHCKPKYRQFFNPEKYRVIMFDQRGCGKSIPSGELRENTTQDLVSDIEKLRNHLNISSWMVYGGSWGSTLALVYAETYPSSVKALHLRGIWLCSKQDIDWFIFGNELKRFFTDLWDQRLRVIKELGLENINLLEGLYVKITRGSLTEQQQASLIIENWEGNLLNVGQDIILRKAEEITEYEVIANRILIHYLINNCFLSENQILNNIMKLPKVPSVIIQGRYDMICPFEQAYELHKALPYAVFEIVQNAGHHSTEPGIEEKIVEYTNKFAEMMK